MNEEIKDIFNEIKHLVEISNYEEHYHLNAYFEVEHIAKLLNYITNLQDENEKLNKIIDELEKWLKETKKFNYGFKIKSEYIYTYEFVCKNILNKLSKLKKRWNK